MSDKVYVMELNINGGEYGYISTHRTYEGAWQKLQEKVDEFGVRDEFELSESGEQRYPEVEGGSVVAAGDEGDAVTYGISYLPIED